MNRVFHPFIKIDFDYVRGSFYHSGRQYKKGDDYFMAILQYSENSGLAILIHQQEVNVLYKIEEFYYGGYPIATRIN